MTRRQPPPRAVLYAMEDAIKAANEAFVFGEKAEASLNEGNRALCLYFISKSQVKAKEIIEVLKEAKRGEPG
jgi:hypothetical protein